MTYRKAMLFFIATLSLSISPCANSQSSPKNKSIKSTTQSGVKLFFIDCSQENIVKSRRLIRNLDRLSAMTYPSEKAVINDALPCKFRFFKDYTTTTPLALKKSKKNVITIVLPENVQLWGFNQAIREQILATLILRRMGINPVNKWDLVPKWLLRALLNQEALILKYKRNGMMLYPAMRAMCLNQTPPNLWLLIKYPLRESDGPAYRVYLEACLVLFESIRHLNPKYPKALKSMLLSIISENNEPTTAFQNAFVEYISSKKVDPDKLIISRNDPKSLEPCELWFLKSLQDLCINATLPVSSKLARKTFSQRIMIPYPQEIKDLLSDKSKSETVSLKRLSEIVEELNDLVKTKGEKQEEEKAGNVKKKKEKEKNDNQELPSIESIKTIQRAFINSALHRFSSIFNLFPEEFQKPLARMMRSFKELSDNDFEDFLKESSEAKEEFEKVAENYSKLENYLEKVESEYVSPTSMYEFSIKTLYFIEQRNEALQPKLYEYLKEVEKEFLNN